MKYIVIGLSIYGQVLVEELTERGHDVVCADASKSAIEHIKDKCVAAYQLDITDELALKSVLPLNSVDAVIVTIGEDLGASLRVVAILKKLEVEHIMARAIDRVHKEILEGFAIERILMPESDAAYAVVTEMDFGNRITTFAAGPEYRIFKFVTPKSFIGLNVNHLFLDSTYHLQLLTVVKGTKAINAIGSPYVKHANLSPKEMVNHALTEDDLLVCFGKVSDFRKLCKAAM